MLLSLVSCLTFYWNSKQVSSSFFLQCYHHTIVVVRKSFTFSPSSCSCSFFFFFLAWYENTTVDRWVKGDDAMQIIIVYSRKKHTHTHISHCRFKLLPRRLYMSKLLENYKFQVLITSASHKMKCRGEMILWHHFSSSFFLSNFNCYRGKKSLSINFLGNLSTPPQQYHQQQQCYIHNNKVLPFKKVCIEQFS